MSKITYDHPHFCGSNINDIKKKIDLKTGKHDPNAGRAIHMGGKHDRGEHISETFKGLDEPMATLKDHNCGMEKPSVPSGGIDLSNVKITITSLTSILGVSRTGNETTGKLSSYYEQTVIDFAKDTITTTRANRYEELYKDGETESYWASDVKYSSFSLSFDEASFQMGQLGDILDKLSAAHNAFRCGDDPKKTDELYEKGVDKAANAFANLFAGFMDKLGGEERRQRIIDSVKEHAHRRDEQYHQAMERHGNRRDIRDAVGGSDFERLAALLRDIVRTELPDILRADRAPKQDDDRSFYSMHELEYAAVSITAYRGTIDSIREKGCGDEMKLALDVSMFEMKISTLSVRLGISEEMEEAQEIIRDQALDELLDAVDEDKKASAAEALEEDAEQVIRRGRRDRFRAVYDKTMDVFRKTGDALGAIREGALTAKDRMRDEDPAGRWEHEMRPGGYWDKFFDRTPYQKGGYQEYARQWNDFLSEISGDKKLHTKA